MWAYNIYDPVLNVMGFTGLWGAGEEALKKYEMFTTTEVLCV